MAELVLPESIHILLSALGWAALGQPDPGTHCEHRGRLALLEQDRTFLNWFSLSTKSSLRALRTWEKAEGYP